MSDANSPRSAPRIAPLDPGERSDEVSELLGQVNAVAGAANIFTTIVRHPGLFRRWVPFAGKVLAGKLPARDRELLILRTGWRCQAEYEWGQHVIIGREAGLSDDEIERVRADDGGWTGHDATLIATADELHETSRISDATWAELAERYDERQLIEIPMLVGHYHMVAYTLNSLGVQLEDGIPGF